MDVGMMLWDWVVDVLCQVMVVVGMDIGEIVVFWDGFVFFVGCCFDFG